LLNVITTDITKSGQTPFKRKFIQVEACYLSPVCVFDLALEQTMTASDLGDLPSTRDQVARQSSEHLKSSMYPKMIEGSYFKPPICHACRSG
jgi:hypothetical protein